MTDAAAPRRERQLELPVALASVSFAFLNFALPLRVVALDGGGLAVGALFSVFTACVLLARPLVGWGLDRFGRRPFLFAALAVYVLALLTYAFAEAIAWLVVARTLQGVAAALLWITVRTVIGDHAPAAELNQAMGRITERSVRGGLIGATVAFTAIGVLGFAVGWRLSFFGFAACSALAAALLLRSGVGMSKTELDAVADGVAAPLRVEPLLIAVAALAAAGAVGFPFVLLTISEAVGGQPERAGAWLLPVALIMAFLPSRAGKLIDRFGMRRVVLPALGMGVCAGLAMAAASTAAVPLLVAAFVVFVAGSASAEPAFAARFSGADASMRGRRFGAYELATGFGGVVGPLLGGLCYDALGPGAAFLFAAGALTLALLVTAWVLAAERAARD